MTMTTGRTKKPRNRPPRPRLPMTMPLRKPTQVPREMTVMTKMMTRRAPKVALVILRARRGQLSGLVVPAGKAKDKVSKKVLDGDDDAVAVVEGEAAA